jgi:hypothetical protein
MLRLLLNLPFFNFNNGHYKYEQIQTKNWATLFKLDLNHIESDDWKSDQSIINSYEKLLVRVIDFSKPETLHISFDRFLRVNTVFN